MMDTAKRDIARLRCFTYDSYGISKYRYKELKSFCLQYDEKKSKIRYGISAVASDGMPHARTVGSPTERRGMENAQLMLDISTIEAAARMVDNITGVKLSPFLLRSVTQDAAYENIEYDPEHGRIPIGKTDFYACRRLFYGCLDRKDKVEDQGRWFEELMEEKGVE